MPFRLVGTLAIAASAMLAALALYSLKVSYQIADHAASTGTFLPLPPQELIERARMNDGFLFGCALLAALGGVVMLHRRSWGMYPLVLAGLLIPAFPWITHLLPQKYWFYGPDLGDFLFGSTLLLVAALGFMFRPRNEIMRPNNRGRVS